MWPFSRKSPPRHETRAEREERQQREWEQTSQDPVAKRHREHASMSQDDFLLKMAEHEETEGRGYCRLSRAESELAYALYSKGLIRENRFQGFVTDISDEGRLRVRQLRIERGQDPDTIFCTRCKHGMFEHRGKATAFGDVDLADGECLADHFNRCRVEGCSCTYFMRSYERPSPTDAVDQPEPKAKAS